MAVSSTSCAFIIENPSTFPTSNLLQSNNPPHDNDITNLRATMHKHLLHLKSLTARIKDVQSPDDTQKFTDEAHAVLVRVYECVVILSPVRRVPPEILCQIFMASILSQDFRTRWNLVHVCRKWRTVALSLPALWSCVIIHSRSTAHKIEAQLAWSDEAPLDVVLSNIWDDSTAHLLNLITDQSLRWRTARLGTVSQMFKRLESIHNRIPMLQELRILCLDLNSLPRLCDIFAQAPKLHTAFVEINYLPWNDPSDAMLPLPFHQLRGYSQFIDIQSHLSALRAAAPILNKSIFQASFDFLSLIPTSSIILSHPPFRNLSLAPVDQSASFASSNAGGGLDKFIIWLATEKGAVPDLEILTIAEDDPNYLYQLLAPSPVDLDIFVGMLKARCKNGKMISGTVGSFNHAFSLEWLKTFKSLRDEGLNFRCVGAEEQSDVTVRKVFAGWCPEDLYIHEAFMTDPTAQTVYY
ncbi:F-box domain-containing protein [Mycena venus]|uniref:F-box domain-containing protein n=1 Tax=Mycena venus TaxID=2733690 RepID=A0A8H6XCU5_9AGAR|nr:F-box domain-containing protein [Mycena venus]